MTPAHDWRALVNRHARATGAPDLPQHTVDELAAHLEDIYTDAIDKGRSEAQALEAARGALLESALATITRPRTRAPESRPVNAVSSGSGLTGIAGDLIYAWRQWRRAPSFALIAIVTLGLGAGAATAIFSVVDAVLLRPLPFRQPEQLVASGKQCRERPAEGKAVAGQLHGLSRRRSRVLGGSGLVAAAGESRRARAGAGPHQRDRDERQPVSAARGVTAARRRVSHDGPFYSRDRIAVISDRLWRQRYRADPSIVGRTLSVNAGDYTIVGVAAAGFNFPDDVDLWLRLYVGFDAA